MTNEQDLSSGIDSPAELDSKRISVKIAKDFTECEVLVDGKSLPVFWLEFAVEGNSLPTLKMGVSGRHFEEIEVSGTLYVDGVINREGR